MAEQGGRRLGLSINLSGRGELQQKLVLTPRIRMRIDDEEEFERGIVLPKKRKNTEKK